jgi:hypothetical protein
MARAVPSAGHVKALRERRFERVFAPRGRRQSGISPRRHSAGVQVEQVEQMRRKL